MTDIEADASVITGLKGVVSGYLGALSSVCSKEIKQKFSEILEILAQCDKIQNGVAHITR